MNSVDSRILYMNDLADSIGRENDNVMLEFNLILYSPPQHVKFISFYHFYHLGPARNILCLEVWDEYSWTDLRLSWNTDKCDVGNLHVHLDKVWTPDVGIGIYR